jgi:DNA-binding XRE family transcriptional regulator
MKKIIDSLLNMRKERRLSQRELAILCKISQNQISLFETGKKKTSIKSITNYIEQLHKIKPISEEEAKEFVLCYFTDMLEPIRGKVPCISIDMLKLNGLFNPDEKSVFIGVNDMDKLVVVNLAITVNVDVNFPKSNVADMVARKVDGLRYPPSFGIPPSLGCLKSVEILNVKED